MIYDLLSRVYDSINSDIDYKAWADFFEKNLDREAKARPELVLDLGCGTGKMTLELSSRGYDMTGIDYSPDMLDVARDAAEEQGADVLWLCQDMRRFELYGTVGAVTCCLDSLNYLTRPKDVQQTFERLRLFIAPGGVLIFDINTVEKLRALDGQVFLDEDEDVYCVWRGEFDEQTNICTYAMDLFQRQGQHWLRSFEEHQEYAYSREQLTTYLKEAGFTHIRVYADGLFADPRENEQRIYFKARKGKWK